MSEQPGRRVYPDNEGRLWLQPGDYGRRVDGTWEARAPNGASGDLSEHVVEEHEDGTITVRPSIRSAWGERPYFHGWLIRGVWSDAA